MYFINNKYLLNQLLWVLKEENNFYNKYNEKSDFNILTNYIYYIENVYKIIENLEK